MNIQTMVVVPLSDVLEEIGIAPDLLDDKYTEMCDAVENETDVCVPDPHEAFTSVMIDEDLLYLCCEAAEIDKDKVNDLLTKISKENNDGMVYVSF
jgi:hypothetical protein